MQRTLAIAQQRPQADSAACLSFEKGYAFNFSKIAQY